MGLRPYCIQHSTKVYEIGILVTGLERAAFKMNGKRTRITRLTQNMMCHSFVYICQGAAGGALCGWKFQADVAGLLGFEAIHGARYRRLLVRAGDGTVAQTPSSSSNQMRACCVVVVGLRHLSTCFAVFHKLSSACASSHIGVFDIAGDCTESR